MGIEAPWIELANAASFNWPLTEDSVVVEVGAYKGRWSTAIYDKYHCQVLCFEPQEWAYNQLVEASKTRPGMHVYNWALGVKDGTFPMGEFGTDACSFLHVGVREQGFGIMRDAIESLNEVLAGSKIDLMMINIEGYEYYLLPYLLGYDIDRICVQWHTFEDPENVQYPPLVEIFLDEGYHILWDYYPTLQAWSRVG